MNAARRKLIQGVIDKLNEIKEEIDIIKDEEQSALDMIPDNLQEGERATTMQTAVDALENSSSSIDDIVTELDEVIQ